MARKSKTNPTPGQIVRQARLAAGLSQTQLAARVGVKQPTISAYEADRPTQLNLGRVIVLANALGLDARRLDPSLEGVYHYLPAENQTRCPTCGHVL